MTTPILKQEAAVRINNFDEVDLNMMEEMAIKEARRCLRCDLETEDGKKQLEDKPPEGGKE